MEPRINHDKDFLKAELECVYTQSTWLFNQVAAIEKLALISSGVIWAWLATHQWNPLYSVIIWIPTIIVSLLSIKLYLLGKSIRSIQYYIVEVEKKFGLDNLGWQNWKTTNKKKYLAMWAWLYWLLLFIANSSIAIFFPFHSLT